MAPPLRPVDHSHLSNDTLMGAHGSSSSCPLYPGSCIQAGRSLCSGMEGLFSADKLTSFSAPRCILSSNAWVSSSPLHISHRRISSQKDSSKKKKKFGKPLVIILIVNISVKAFFFYLNFILPIVKTSYCRSLQIKTRFIFLL